MIIFIIIAIITWYLFKSIRHFEKRIFSEKVGFGPMSFLVLFILTPVLVYHFPGLTFRTKPDFGYLPLAYYLLAVSMFVYGFGLFASLINRKERPEHEHTNEKPFKQWFFIVVLIGLCLNFYTPLTQILSRGIMYTIAHSRDIYQDSAINKTVGASVYLDIIADSLSKVFGVILFITFYIYSKSYKHKILLYVLASLYLMSIVLSGNRASIIIPVVFPALTYLFFFKITTQTKYRLGMAVVALFFIFVGVTLMRYSFFKGEGKFVGVVEPEVWFTFLPEKYKGSVFGFLCSNIAFSLGHTYTNFSGTFHYLDELPPSYGVKSIRGLGALYRLFNHNFADLCFNNQDVATDICEQKFNSQYQWFGWLGYYLIDFGKIGTLIFMFFKGILFSMIMYQLRLRKTIVQYIGISTLFILGWTSIISPFTSTMMYWALFLCLLLLAFTPKYLHKLFFN